MSGTKARTGLPTFAAFQFYNYRFFWAAMMASMGGQFLWRATQGWLVLELTNQSFQLGLVGFLSMLPSLLLSLFAGVAVDRTDKRRLLMLTQVGFGLPVLILAVLASTSVVAVWHVMAIAFLIGIVVAFFFPTRQATVPDILPKEHVMNGIALNSAGFYVANIASSIGMGWLISRTGVGGSFFMGSALFGASLAGLLFMQSLPRPSSAPQRHVMKEVAEGLGYVRSNAVAFACLAFTAVGSLFHTVVLVLMPVFARDVLEVGATGMGFLLAASGVGSFVGTLALASMGNYRGKGLLILITLVLQGITQAVFGLSTNFYLSMVSLAVNGAVSAMHISVIVTVLQLMAPNELRGRIMGLYFLLLQGFSPLGSLLSGWLAQAVGAPVATALLGAIILLVAVAALVGLPFMRKVS